jgi:hypothetical protein
MFAASPLKSWAIRAVLASLLATYCFALSSCDKCGDWFGQGSTKSCRDESQVK